MSMRKITLVLSVFVLLTLPLTDVAVAAWKANTVTNQTTENVYVIYSTWRGAKGSIPRGYRTLGYYRISPGQQRSFSAWAGNSIYFRISQSGEAMKPQSSTETFAFWIHPRAAFTLVSGKLNAAVTTAQLTYTNKARGELALEDGFMKYANGARLTVTSGWVPVSGVVTPPEEASVDVNGDCKVDASDIAFIASRLGRTGADAADVNGDGVVNAADITLVTNALGTVIDDCDGTSPGGGGTEASTEGMVLIPAGEFRMGSNDAAAGSNEKPVHSVYVDAFYMDEYEVTNAQYAAFLTAKGKHAEAGHTWLDIGDGDERIERVGGVYRATAGYENHPVVEVSWYGAMAYAEWKGKRLPTEAEWEKAARGGLSGLKYPWGNTIDSGRANYNNHIGGTTAVGKHLANGYGLYDMAGNVWEWCLDEYNAGFYAVSPSQNPLSGATNVKWLLDNYTGVKSSRVLRGGSWYYGARYVRVADRYGNSPTGTSDNYGFRCARAVSP